jgi:hypothetical protein
VNILSIFAIEWNFEIFFQLGIGDSSFNLSYLKARVRKIEVGSPANCS